jgi:mediator of RNA polymerase II transcription subunit 17
MFPSCCRVLSIRSGPVSGLKVMVQKLGEPVNLPNIVDKNYSLLGGKFHPVSLDRIEGKTFVNKLELLMACLSQELA